MTGLGIRALRLATTPYPRESRADELTRLFGGPVEVVVAVRMTDPRDVARTAHDSGARAVLADSFRGDLDELRQALAPVPVLRPVFKRRAGLHAGPPTEEFSAYARLVEDGRLAELPDGALAPD